MKIEIDLLAGDADLLFEAMKNAFNPHREIGTIEQADMFGVLDNFIVLKNKRDVLGYDLN